MIRLSPVSLGKEEEELVLEVVRSGRLAQGPMVQRLEQAFRDLTGAAEAIALSSGTTALVASLQGLGIGQGDEVITSPFTFAASVNAILEAGATARFADISLDDFNIEPSALDGAIGERTAAVLPVHLYGCPADLASISAAAERRGLALVEDAAQAHGAAFGDRPVGAWGIGCFSLYATKNVTTGEGGVVTTDDGAIADRIRLLRNQGMRERYRYEVPGHNYRMTELQAAIGIPQMQRLASNNERRRTNAARLSEGLDGLPGIVVPPLPDGRTHVFHQYTIRVTGRSPMDRDELSARLAASGIETGIYYPRVVFDHEVYRAHPGVRTDPMPRAEQAAREVLSLPVHPGLEDGQIDQIVETIRSLVHAEEPHVPG